MCFRLIIHNTDCETRRPVCLQKIPNSEIPHFDIYHPFEEPRKCEHHMDTETTHPPCTTHGSCCSIYTEDVCDEMVHRGNFSCLGLQHDAHFVRTEAVLKDPVAVEFCESATRANGREMQSSKEVLAALRDYLDTGADVHEFMNRHDLKTSRKGDEKLLADILGRDDPALQESWTKACASWNDASSDFWRIRTADMDENEQRLCRQRGITPFWMEAFRIPSTSDEDQQESGSEKDENDESVDNDEKDDGDGGNKNLKHDVLTNFYDSFNEEAAEEYDEMMATDPQPIYATHFTASPERNDPPTRLSLTSNHARENPENAPEPTIPRIAEEDVDPDNLEHETDYPETRKETNDDDEDNETPSAGEGFLSNGGIDYLHNVPERVTILPGVFTEPVDLDSLEHESDGAESPEQEDSEHDTSISGYLATGNNYTHYLSEREYYEDMDYHVDEQDYWEKRHGSDYSGEETIPEESEDDDDKESMEAGARDFETEDRPDPNVVPAVTAGGDGGDSPDGDDSRPESKQDDGEESSDDESKDDEEDDEDDGDHDNGDDDTGGGDGGGGHRANGDHDDSYSERQEPLVGNVVPDDAEDPAILELQQAQQANEQSGGSQATTEATTERLESGESDQEVQSYDSSDKENESPNDLITANDVNNMDNTSPPAPPTLRHNTTEPLSMTAPLPVPDGIVTQPTRALPPVDGLGDWHALHGRGGPDRSPTSHPDIEGPLVDACDPEPMPSDFIPDGIAPDSIASEDEAHDEDEGTEENEDSEEDTDLEEDGDPDKDEDFEESEDAEEDEDPEETEEMDEDDEDHNDEGDDNDEEENRTHVYYITDDEDEDEDEDEEDEPGPFMRPIALARMDQDIRWRPVNWTAGVTAIPWSAANEVTVSPTDETSQDIFGNELDGAVGAPQDYYVTSTHSSRRATWPPEAISTFVPDRSNEPLNGPDDGSEVEEAQESRMLRRGAVVTMDGATVDGNDTDDLPDYESEEAEEPLRPELRIVTTGDAGLQHSDSPHCESPEEDEYLPVTTPMHPSEESCIPPSTSAPTDLEPEAYGFLPHNIGAYHVYVPVVQMPESPRLSSLKRKACGEDHDDKWPSGEKRRKTDSVFRIRGLASSVPDFYASSTESTGRSSGLSEVVSIADSSESRGTKRKAGEVSDSDYQLSESEEGEKSDKDSEKEEKHDDDETPLSPPPREWKLRRLSMDLRRMGSRIPEKKRRFF